MMKLCIFTILSNLLDVVNGGDLRQCNDCLTLRGMSSSSGESSFANIDCSVPCSNDGDIYNICPSLSCGNYCQYGHMVDVSGCQLCQCIQSLPPPITGIDCILEQPSCSGYQYICPKITEVTNCNQGGIDGYTTFRISVVIKPGADVTNLYALYGDEYGNNIFLPRAYQTSINYGSNIGGVNPFFLESYPNVMYDSWLTIGISNGNLNNKLSSIGIDFNKWDENHDLDITNGGVFVMDPEETIVQGREYLIGQITVVENSNPSMIVNVQGKTKHSGNTWNENGIVFDLISPQNINHDNVPINCDIWYDGCNTCMVNNGIIGSCSHIICITEDINRCLSYVSPLTKGSAGGH